MIFGGEGGAVGLADARQVFIKCPQGRRAYGRGLARKRPLTVRFPSLQYELRAASGVNIDSGSISAPNGGCI